MKHFDSDRGAASKEAFEEMELTLLVTGGVALTRLPDEDREEVARSFETGAFQAGGRTVTNWVQVTIEDGGDRSTLERDVTASDAAPLAEAD